MKGFRSIIPAVTLAGALLAASLPGSVGAQTKTFSSGFQIQNLTSTEATISMAFYPADTATPSDTVPGTVPASGSATYATLPDAVDSGFSGSAVISSDQRIAAIVNLVSPSLGSLVGGTAGALGEAYIGVTGGAQQVALPLLFKNASGFSTFFSVQNVGQTETTVTVTYSGGGLSSTVSEDATIAPGSSHRFDQSANTSLPNGFNGSAIVESTASDVAAVVTQVGSTTALVYNGFASGSNLPVFPLVNANNAGYITGIALQNIGDQETTVTVQYTPSTSGTACTEELTIAPNGGTQFFAINAFANNNNGDDCANGTTFVGSARVITNSASQPLVGIVNQLNVAAGTSGNKGGSYSSFDAAAATDTVVFPLVQDRVAGFFTGLSIVNLGSTAVTIECSFSNTQVTQTSPQPIAQYGTYTPVQVGNLADGYNGSGTCTAVDGSGNPVAGAQIIGIANQVRLSPAVDAFFVYEGTND